MNKTFHYKVIKILGLKAGFSEDEAETIAYASQYVDDATIENKFYLSDPPAGFAGQFQPLFKSGIYSPVQTSHEGAGYLEALVSKEQMEVWVSFHFIPGEPFKGGSKNKFIAIENGLIANDMLKKACNELKNSNTVYNQIKLGVCLHSFADTWAHDDFCGILNLHNKKNECFFLKGSRWEAAANPGMFKIGHAASSLPDDSNKIWKYTNPRSQPAVPKEKDNKNRFLIAAEEIYKNLCDVKSKNNDFDVFKSELEQSLASYSPETVFPDIAFEYLDKKWDKQARKLDTVKTSQTRDHWYYQYNGDLKWYYFHQAALEQRDYVLNQIGQLV